MQIRLAHPQVAVRGAEVVLSKTTVASLFGVATPSEISAAGGVVVSETTSSRVGMPLAESGVHTVRVGNVGALATDRILEIDTCLTADEHVLSEILSFHPESDGSSGSRAGAQILNERISKFDSLTSVLGRTRLAVTDVDRRTGNVSLATAFGNTGNKRPSTSIAFVVDK